MRRRAAVVLVAVAACAAGGCAGEPSVLVGAADRFANQSVGPEYLAWAHAKAARGELTAEELADRQNNVREFRAAVEAAQRLNAGWGGR